MQVILSRAEQMAVSSLNDRRRSAWVICDDPAVRSDIECAVTAAGLRSTRHLSVMQASDAIRDRPDGAVVVLHVPDEAQAGEEKLLGRIDAEAGWRERGAVVSFGNRALDRVAAAVSAPYASLVCEPTLTQWVAAMSYADAAAAEPFREVDSIKDTMRLQQIADEVGRIARALSGEVEYQSPRAVSDGLIGYRSGPVEPRPDPGPIAVVRADDIRAMIRLRRQRDGLFPANLFADPAWDMMLDLMAARIERLRVAVSSLCIAAAVPPTTALRWIKTLTDIGIFVRVADPTDGRRVFIELSDGAASAILDFLGRAKRATVLV